MNILALLQPIQNSVSKTTLRQLSRIILVMIAMTGRVTMPGLSRWTEKGDSYRTVQRFLYTVIPWAEVFWAFFHEYLLDRQDTYLLTGDECIVAKSAFISTKQRRSYPVCVEQIIRTSEEKAVSQAKKQAKRVKPEGPKRKPGRPKGSRNKNKAEVLLNPELPRI
jgi:putative transposase